MQPRRSTINQSSDQPSSVAPLISYFALGKLACIFVADLMVGPVWHGVMGSENSQLPALYSPAGGQGA